MEDYGLIELIDADDVWARGHIDNAEATKRLREYMLDYEGEDVGRCVAVKRTYARWVPRPDGMPEMQGATQEFIPGYDKGPGAFPVTLIAPWSEVRRDRAREAMMAARCDLFREHLERTFPGAESIEVEAIGDYYAMGTLRFPCVEHWVKLRSDLPWQAECQRVDADAVQVIMNEAKGRT